MKRKRKFLKEFVKFFKKGILSKRNILKNRYKRPYANQVKRT
ncbi:hypothetical protein CAMRE0001_3129 [Campylobacter rectus RM3267]|uniref:Uncharacterized protein n=1 Tax=Campylobacter rectus RM3267 TaxID=553218 RepID=B9D144_CAMRE|nr:hypothetical protein CAMRE0001_3129 [Campylobacter rectus RM3267]